MTNGINFNFFVPQHPPALVDFTADMLQVGVEHDLVMKGMSTYDQVDYMGKVVKAADALLVVFNAPQGPLQKGLYVAKGAAVLKGSGFDLGIAEIRGNPPGIRTRRLNRPLVIEAFVVDTYMQATFMDYAWGDANHSVRIRRWNKKDGGEQAVQSIRMAVTPAGRAFLAANKHLWDSRFH